MFKAGTFVSPVVDLSAASLTGAGTAASPFSFAIPAANLPDANRYAVKVAGVNANGPGPWSALSEVAVYGEPSSREGQAVHWLSSWSDAVQPVASPGSCAHAHSVAHSHL